MHLLVLSAFRLEEECPVYILINGLNAPFGAQCFPTSSRTEASAQQACLNAPFGAQCFPTGWAALEAVREAGLNAPFGAQCFPTVI